MSHFRAVSLAVECSRRAEVVKPWLTVVHVGDGIVAIVLPAAFSSRASVLLRSLDCGAGLRPVFPSGFWTVFSGSFLLAQLKQV